MTGKNDRRMDPGRGIVGVIAAAVLLTLGAQGAVGAPSDKKPRRQPAASQNEARKQAPTTVTRSVGGVQVAIDPKTGLVQQPTAEEAQALASALQHMLSRETKDLPVRTLPDGTLMVSLEDTFQEVLMATVDQSGNVRLHCVDDAAMATSILNGTARVDDAPVYGKARMPDRKPARTSRESTAEKE